MEKSQIYISNEEREKCRRVADAFSELDDAGILVVEAGRYGFVKLQNYKHPNGFESCKVFHDSRKLYEDLWREWLIAQILILAKSTPIMDLDDVYRWDHIPKEKREELIRKKNDFAERAGI